MTQYVRLGDVCGYDKRQGTHSGLPYLGLEHIESGSGRFDLSLSNPDAKSLTFRFSSKHVLYGRLRPYLKKVALPETDGRCSTEIFPILPGNSLDRRFLAYWLLSDEATVKINATCTGARMPRADMEAVLDLPLFVPDLKEQHRIVALLDEAFAGIATAKANAEKSLRRASEIFERRVEIEFLEGKAGWRRKRLKELCDKITDGTHQTPEYFDSGVVFLSSRNVTTGTIDWDNVKFIDERQHNEMHKRVSPRRGDILLAKNGTTGVAAIVDRDVVFDIYVSLALIRSLGEVSSEFLLYFLNSPVAKAQFNSRLKGVGVPNLHLQEIREVMVSYPEDRVQQAIVVDELNAFRAEVSYLQSLYTRKLAALDELKQSLLQRAFSGEL